MVVRPAKTQISLGISPVWPESSLSAWRNLGSLATQWVYSEDSGQTGWMPRLIWVFTGRTTILLVLSWGGSLPVLKEPRVYWKVLGIHLKSQHSYKKPHNNQTVFFLFTFVDGSVSHKSSKCYERICVIDNKCYELNMQRVSTWHAGACLAQTMNYLLWPSFYEQSIYLALWWGIFLMLNV